MGAASNHRTVSDDGTIIVGGSHVPFGRNIYHLFLRASWPQALGGIVAAFLGINLMYGVLYLLAGGVANARPGSFFDAFIFSVQTIATIGYGSMVPTTVVTNLIVVTEAVVGLLLTAISTGLVFAKFTLRRSMIDFAKYAAIAPMNGVPTLMIRLGNMRDNVILEATARVTALRTERTAEGQTWYRMIDLPLARERTAALSRSWSILHVIDERSPLYGANAETLAHDEVEIIVSLTGIDDTSMQQVHARKRYLDHEVLFGMRHADMLSTLPDGKLVLDVDRFHEVVPVDAERSRLLG
jgi:inward rectifier potassium channel